MAIYWVDPYFHSANGFLPSSTSTAETGSYSAPFKLDYFYRQKRDNPTSGILQNGDEIRFKGLSESVFFPASRKTAFAGTSSGYDSYTRYTVNPSHGQSNIVSENSGNQSLVKIKDVRGNYLYVKMNNGDNQLQSLNNNEFWKECLPLLDISYGSSFFDQNYQLHGFGSSFSDNNSVFLFRQNWVSSYNFGVPPDISVTITSGWDSETTQNGITVIDFRNSSSASFSSMTWGVEYYGSYTSRSYLVNWNCPEMILINPGNKNGMNVYGYSLKFKAVKSCSYIAGAGVYLYSGVFGNQSPNTTPSNAIAGNISIEHWGGGGYVGAYVKNAYSNNILELPIITCMYQGPYIGLESSEASWMNSFTGGSSGTDYINYRDTYSTELKLKMIVSSYDTNISQYNNDNNNHLMKLKLTLDNDWEFYSYNDSNCLSFDNGSYINLIEENVGTPENNMFSGNSSIKFNKVFFKSAGVVNQSFPTSSLDSSNSVLYSNANSILKSTTFNGAYTRRTYFKKWIIENGENIENVSLCPLTVYNYPRAQADAVKIPVLLEPQSGQTVQFMGSCKSDGSNHTPVLIYRSSNYSNKITWKLWASSDDLTYKDTIQLPLYNYSTNNIDVGVGITRSNSGISAEIRFIGFSLLDGYVNDIVDPINVTFTDNLYSDVITINKNKFKDKLITSLFVQYKITKTYANITHVAFDDITVNVS